MADEQVEKFRFQEENEKAIARGEQPAIGEPVLLGITKASLSTQSFISAASFQRRHGFLRKRVWRARWITSEV